MTTALEFAARALCRLYDHPHDVPNQGKPLWMDSLPKVRAVLTEI